LARGNIYVGTNAHVRLLINGGNTTGVTVASDGGANDGQLTVYVAVANFSIGGNGQVDGGRAANLTYFGLPSNTSISFSGNAGFTGTIYAPDADIKLNGGGGIDYDFVGSLIAKTVTVDGHFKFHFDEDLLNAGPSRGYLAVSWTEL